MENWTIFGETLKPGEMRRTTLRIPMGGLPNHGALRPAEDRAGDYEMPMFLLNGGKEGKTVLISASIHSGEYAGVPAVIRAGRELDPEKLCGRLILLPCVNTSGFWDLSHALVPENGSNLNRTYPGDAGGGVGERIKAFFVRELIPRLDFMLDLHGGSVAEKMTPLIFYPKAEKVTEVSLAAARATGVEVLVASDADNGQYSYAANFLDVPGMLLERGGGFYCDRESGRKRTTGTSGCCWTTWACTRRKRPWGPGPGSTGSSGRRSMWISTPPGSGIPPWMWTPR